MPAPSRPSSSGGALPCAAIQRTGTTETHQGNTTPRRGASRLADVGDVARRLILDVRKFARVPSRVTNPDSEYENAQDELAWRWKKHACLIPKDIKQELEALGQNDDDALHGGVFPPAVHLVEDDVDDALQGDAFQSALPLGEDDVDGARHGGVFQPAATAHHGGVFQPAATTQAVQGFTHNFVLVWSLMTIHGGGFD